ncbi:PAS domain-containing sensor histidine kinase [Microseira wollei]|uniref:histidine kinase n=1 Tax=Microseira wollei NIES-4236 TaxID=2530354 RepID=A0AAV3XQJ7_9CYAN|nr:PAS domain S-box protein [Microseira wollei]GET43064.1 multi-sensor signal transduction histidine kinase [Microseira wollei NIES-4236]
MTLDNIEAGLHTERDFLAAVLDQIGVLVVVIDLKGKIVRFNSACEATTGYSFEEVLGKSCWDLCLIPEPVEAVTGVLEQHREFPKQWENYWVAKDGTLRLIAWSNNALVNSSGAVEYIVSTGIDITERRQAETAMRDSEERLRLALDAADMGIWDWNILTGATSWSPNLEQIYGIKLDSCEGSYEEFLGIVYEQDRARVTDAIRACLEEKQDYDVEFRVVASNGDIRWVRSRGRVVYDETGAPVRMAGVDLDISNRQQAAAALQASERFIQSIADAVPGIIYIYDIIENRNIYCNHQASVVLGYTFAEIQQLGAAFFSTVMHPDDLANIQAMLQKFATTKDGEVIETEYRIRQKNGEWRWFLSRDTVFLRNSDGSPQQILGTACDITSRKQTEAALRKSENLYRTLAQNFPNGIVLLFDSNLRYSLAEGQGLPLVGLDKETMEGKTIWEVFPPEICEELEPIYRSVLVGEEIAWEMSFRNRIGYVQALPVKNEQGEIFAGMMVVQDITERKEAENLQTQLIVSLRESEDRFRCLIDQARDGIFVIDLEGWFVEVNQRSCQDLGYTYAELLTLGLWDLDPNWSEKRFAQLFKQQRDLRGDDTFEAAIKRKDGSTFPVEIRVGLLEWNHEQYMLALVRDITKRKRAEQVQTGLIEFLQESDERFRQMAENIRDIFWMRQVNPPQLLYISPAYEEIWGRSCTSLYQDPNSFLDAVHPEDRPRVEAAFARQIQGHQTDDEYKIVHETGAIRWVHDRGFPIRNQLGEVYRITGIAEDITERKLAQMALQQAKEELEMRVAERTAALLIANHDLEQEIIDRRQAELALAKSQQELELFFSQSLDGFFFMMLEEPVGWDDTVDKEKVLDYVFSHQRMTKINDAMLAQYGATIEQFLGLTPKDLFAHDLDYGRQVWKQFFDLGRLHVETNERKLDGTPIWIEGDYICLYDQSGRIVGHFGVQRDISDRKLAQQALQESEERFRQLAENIESVFWMTDPNKNQMIYVSPAYEKIWGRTCAALYATPKSFLDAIHPEDRSRVVAAMPKQVKGEYDEEYRIIQPDGSIRWIRDRAFPVRDRSGKVYRVTGIAEDISDRKMAEQALQESQKRYTLAVSAGKVGVWDWNLETNEIYVDPFLKAILGYADSEIPNHLDHWGKLVHPDDGEQVMVVADAYLQGLTKEYSVEHRMLHKDGSIRWFLARGTAIRDASGKAYRMIGTDTDITDRKLAEAALRKSEERFRSLVVNVPGAIYRSTGDSHRTMEYISDAIANISHYPAKDFIGGVAQSRDDSCGVGILPARIIPETGETPIPQNKTGETPIPQNETGKTPIPQNKTGETPIPQNKTGETPIPQNNQNHPANMQRLIGNRVRTFTSIIHPQDIPLVETSVPDAVALKKSFQLEYRIVQPDGSIRWVADRGQAKYGEGGEVLWIDGVIFDISDRKQAEEEIRNALAKEKELSELKTRFITMASHEFRTPLSTILSSADLLEYYVEENSTEKQLEHIQRIQTACLNMTQLLNDVLVIGRAEAGKLEFKPSPINLVEFCRDFVEEMQLSAGYQHRITFELTPDRLPKTEFIPGLDEKLLRYILNNLVSNAIKYSPYGGNVSLRLYYQDSHAILQVEDEGIGIPPEDEDHLFEPFYRGKNVENISGTGLGLAIVKRAVDLHGGQIAFKSKISRGTTFIVTLPLPSNC